MVYLCIVSANRGTRTIQCGITRARDTFGITNRYIVWQPRTACDDPHCRLGAALAHDWWVCQWPSLARMVQQTDTIHSVELPSAVLGGSVPLSDVPLGVLPHLAILLRSTWETLL